MSARGSPPGLQQSRDPASDRAATRHWRPAWAWAAVLSLLLFHLGSPAQSPPFRYWTTSALEKVRPADPVPSPAAQAATLFAARNEFEPFQLVLRAESKPVSEVDVEVSDLAGPGGAVLSRRNITVYFERYLLLKQPSTTDSEAGEWPDPLIPRVDRYAGEKRNAFPFRLEPGRNQPIWIEVYVPQTAAPGVYTGQATVLARGARQASIPISLQVWNFTLPSTSTLRNSFGFNGVAALSQHRGKYTNDDDLLGITLLYAKSALLHRLSLHRGANIPPRIPRGQTRIDWALYEREMEPQITGSILSSGDPLPGARVTSVDIRLPAEIPDKLKIVYYREWVRQFRSKGRLPLLFHYLWDEPQPDDFARLVQQGKVAHQGEPGIRNLVTVQMEPQLQPVVDIWTPLINCFEPKPGFPSYCRQTVPREAYAGELRAGKELWWYQSCASHGCGGQPGGQYFHGWPSYMVDASAVSNRILQWLAWKYRIEGELYFNTDEAYRKLNPWEDVLLFGGNGDGTLFYPGKPSVIGGATDIPIESIRLKLIREGFEDYEYLALAARRGLSDLADKSVASIATSLYAWNRSPEALYAARRALGDKLSQRIGAESPRQAGVATR